MVNRDGDVLVVGGYGEVGRSVCHALDKALPGQVIAGGRNQAKAQKFAESTAGAVKSRLVDLTKGERHLTDALQGVDTVVMCVDQKETVFPALCFREGVRYVDISPDYAWLAQVLALQNRARDLDATAILSVGLAPGLTNLVASACADLVLSPQGIDISILLGGNDDHGSSTIRWTMTNLFNRLPGSSSKKVDYGSPWGTRDALPFDFSDQHALRETLGIDSVHTRLTPESRAMAWLMGLFRFLNQHGLPMRFLASDLHVELFRRMKVGTNAFAIKVEAHGYGSDGVCSACAMVRGHSEATVTALVTAEVVRLLRMRQPPPGVYHIDEVFRLADISHLFNDQLQLEGPEIGPVMPHGTGNNFSSPSSTTLA